MPRIRQQPQNQERIDPSHWLGSNIKHAYLPGNNGGYAIDRKGLYNIIKGVGSAAPGISVFGPLGAVTTGAGSQDYYGPIASFSDYPRTMVVAGYFTTSAAGHPLMGLWRSAGSGDECAIRLSSSTVVEYRIRNNFFAAGFGVQLSVPGGTTQRVPLVVVAQSLSRTDHRLYCNGKMVTSSTDAGPIGGAFNRLGIGNSSTGGATPTARMSAGGMSFCATLSSPLSDDEALRISADIGLVWDAFLPRKRLIVSQGSAGAVTASATITPAAQTVTADGTVVLTTSATITPAAQTVTAAGVVTSGVTANASLTPASQTATAAGTVALGGAASITPASETVSSAAVVALQATAVITPAAETISAAGVVTSGVVANANIAVDAQSVTSSGVVALVAGANIVVSPQTLTASGTSGSAGQTLTQADINAIADAVWARMPGTVPTAFATAVWSQVLP